jgi:oligoendopeptidase F
MSAMMREKNWIMVMAAKSNSADAAPAGATSAETKSANGVAWDLSALFDSPEDPRIEQTLSTLSDRADAFDRTYRGTIDIAGGPPPQHLLSGLREAEAIQSEMMKVSAYARLLYAADTTKDSHRALVQKVDEAMTALRNKLLFFDLEWLGLSDADAERSIQHPALETYRHYLHSERRYQPHTLTEPEERIINDKDLTGINAWQKLFTEFTSAAKYRIEKDGEVRELNQSEVLTLMRDPDRAMRRQAHESFFGALERNSQISSFIYDTRFQDHLVSNRLRKYEDPMAPRHLANEIDGEAVETMMRVVEKNFPLAHRYFALKASLLKLPRLELYDQYAPLFDVKERIIYPEAKDIVLSALNRFSTSFSNMARRFFDESWIDADPRAGKRGGAFCAGVVPSLHPYILVNYNDDMRDVMTLAHELGHGLHDMLASKQTLFNYYPTLPVAETASVFAEMLVFDDLLASMNDAKQKLALICGKLEDSFATVFRQTVLTRFERLAYDARANGRLSGERIGQLWLQANAPYYGEAVNMTEGYEWGWSYIPHFINTPFYCYAYSFGELLVLALYGMYRREGKSFAPKYTALLASGGSQAPTDQMAAIGIDIHDASFWQVGFDELARLVDEARRLSATSVLDNA